MSVGTLQGFERHDIATSTPHGEATIHIATAGSGPPVLLLHGYPQTSAMWEHVAPRLAERYTVACADLRGYGRSSKPRTDEAHRPYSKREMALDMVQVMAALGHERFHVGSHDRGARVGHRMAVDHPGAVRSLVVLDIAPTREMYRATDEAFARAYWHWFWLTLPAPHPRAPAAGPRSGSCRPRRRARCRCWQRHGSPRTRRGWSRPSSRRGSRRAPPR